MIKIYIFADSHKHFSQGVEEYKKRLSKTVEIIELKPIKKGNDFDIINTETHIIKEKISKQTGYKIVLSPKGKVYSTEKLSTLIEAKKDYGEDILFIIGGANGLDYDLLKDNVDFELSLGEITLPHSLAFLVLLEQIYRVEQISKGTKYHK